MYACDCGSYKLYVEALLIKEDFQTTIETLKPAIDAVIVSVRGNYAVIIIIITRNSSSSSSYYRYYYNVDSLSLSVASLASVTQSQV